MMNCSNIQRLLSCFKRERDERVYRVSEGTADHTESQRALRATVEHVISECKKIGTPFTDDEFPILANESEELLGDIKQWRRIDHVSPRAANGRTKWSMFDNPQPSDVAQRFLGDCWLVSAISVIANKPHILKRIFVTNKYNKQGVYGLQLYVDGEWKYVIVDDRFPCNEHGEIVFTWGHKMQLWVPLLEKALAKLFGSYSALEQGGFMAVSYTLLTGAPVETFFSAEDLSTEEDMQMVFNRIRNALKDNLLISCNTPVVDDNKVLASVGLEKSHTYSILDATIVDQYHRLLFLRNIWGFKSFTGDWSPFSDRWGRVINRKNFPEDTGYASKGTFWIAIEDFAEYFLSLHICYSRENYHEYHIKASLPQEQSDEWETFEVEVMEETCLDLSFKPIEGIVTKYKNSVITTVFIFDENEELIGSTNCHEMHVTIWKGKILPPGIYRVYLFSFIRWRAANTIKYNFVTHSSREVVCRKITKPIIELRIILAKLVVLLGTQTQIKEVTFYTLQGDYWFGSIIAASNSSQRTRICCGLKRSCFENAISTRTLGDTFDSLAPKHSQILQILSVDDLGSGVFKTDVSFVVQHLKSEGSTQHEHYPPITGDTAKLHQDFPTNRIFE